MNTPRKILAEAQAELLDAVERHELAQSSTASAKAYVATAEGVVQKLKDKQAGVAASRTIALIESLKAGKTPAAIEAAANAVELDHALGVADLARQALSTIEAEEFAEAKAASVAREAVAKAARNVVIDEAQSIVERIRTLESESLRLRARLHAARPMMDGDKLLPPEISMVLNENAAGEIGTRNTHEWRLAEAARPVWQAFKVALSADPAAALRFAS